MVQQETVLQMLRGPMVDSAQEDDDGNLDEQRLLQDGDIESSGELRSVAEAATASNSSFMRLNGPGSFPGMSHLYQVHPCASKYQVLHCIEFDSVNKQSAHFPAI